jgi:hypothetical protein
MRLAPLSFLVLLAISALPGCGKIVGTPSDANFGGTFDAGPLPCTTPGSEDAGVAGGGTVEIVCLPSGGTQPCLAVCDGRPCGGDGCGGACGTCSSGEYCTAAGRCSATASPGCGGGVTSCSDGHSCPANAECSSAGCVCSTGFVPAYCNGEPCGADGCAGGDYQCIPEHGQTGSACLAWDGCASGLSCVALDPEPSAPHMCSETCDPSQLTGACGTSNSVPNLCLAGLCFEGCSPGVPGQCGRPDFVCLPFGSHGVCYPDCNQETPSFCGAFHGYPYTACESSGDCGIPSNPTGATCTTDASCGSGKGCDASGMCVAGCSQAPAGACAFDSDCTSGSCTEGHCDTCSRGYACDGASDACAIAAAPSYSACSTQAQCASTDLCSPTACGAGSTMCLPGCNPTAPDACPATPSGSGAWCEPTARGGGICVPGDGCDIAKQDCPDGLVFPGWPEGPDNPKVPYTCQEAAPGVNICGLSGEIPPGDSCGGLACGDNVYNCQAGLVCVAPSQGSRREATCEPQCANPLPPGSFTQAPDCPNGSYCDAIEVNGQTFKSGSCEPIPQ